MSLRSVFFQTLHVSTGSETQEGVDRTANTLGVNSLWVRVCYSSEEKENDLNGSGDSETW